MTRVSTTLHSVLLGATLSAAACGGGTDTASTGTTTDTSTSTVTGAGAGSEDEGTALAFLEDCPDWNEDFWNCTPDCDTPTAQLWADGFRAHLVAERGWTEAQLESSLDVKMVLMEENGSVFLEALVQIDWVRATTQIILPDALPEPATVDEAATRWSAVWTPHADVLDTPRSYAELEAARQACFAAYDVSLDQALVEYEWCSPWLTELVSFSFVVEVPSDWDSHTVRYAADAHGLTPDVCEYDIYYWYE